MRVILVLMFCLLAGTAWAGPLHDVARAGDVVAVQALIESGANVHARDSKGATALHYAAGWGNVEAVQALLAAGANAKAKDFQGGTLLHMAAVKGNVEIIKVLLAAGAENVPDRWGRTPVAIAAHLGHEAVVQVLQAAK